MAMICSTHKDVPLDGEHLCEPSDLEHQDQEAEQQSQNTSKDKHSQMPLQGQT